MFFNVISWGTSEQSKPINSVYLLKDNWDDFGYKTQFFVLYTDNEGRDHKIGYVKIGQFLEREGFNTASPSIPSSFDFLGQDYFSVGQGESYYQNLNELGEEIRDRILSGLQDLAKSPSNLERVASQNMMNTSLMRDVTLQMIKGRFNRLANGDARLTTYKFSYSPPNNQLILSFEVIPESEPPTNIHVLIGRNGVGKTYVLTNMTLSLISEEKQSEKYGVISANDLNEDEGLFVNLISVSFSAFDPFDSLPVPNSDIQGTRYSYIGLKEVDNETKKWKQTPKDIRSLTEEFVNSVENCLLNNKIKRLERAVGLLSSDPIFDSYGLLDVVRNGEKLKLKEIEDQSVDWYDKLTALFGKLSSGHKIVLLTITKLVEDVVERTLILIDEPESHLHPPLLSAFVRALSDLLLQQNGVAIVATHSPVVIQEVPKSCVWKLRRSGSISKADRPISETFGENVGVLTRDIFGLEVTQSGFHKMLQDAAETFNDYESVINHFDGQLGAEARAIVQGLLINKK